MDWEKLFVKLFDSGKPRPLPFKEIAQDVEMTGKWGVAVLGALYVIGLVIFGAYYSGLYIRSIELFKVRYLFVGFYFCFFVFAHLLVQHKYVKRWWLKAVYITAFSLVLACWDDVFTAYLNNCVTSWLTGKSYFQLRTDLVTYVVINLTALIGTSILSPVVFSFAGQLLKRNVSKFWAVLALVFSFGLEYGIFVQSLFPNIPEAIGGGKPPIVHIEFANNAPYTVISNFDVSNIVERYKGLGPIYYAKLIYVDDNSIFLQEAFWYSKTVYELRRDQVDLLEYCKINPVTLEQSSTL